jgi:hypothetical protein
MHKVATLIIFCLFSIYASYICNGVDSTNSNVCSSKGKCVGDNLCSCYSGYSGFDCTQTISSPTCSWNTLSQTKTDFIPIMKSADFNNDRLKLVIASPLVNNRLESQIFIQNTTYDQCNYPGDFTNNVLDNNAPCANDFEYNLPWAQGKNCGWNVKDGLDEKVYSGNVYVQQRENLGMIRGTSIDRTLRRVIPLVVRFKTRVTVSTVVKVSAAVNVFAAIVLQAYVPDPHAGIIEFITNIQYPFVIDTKQDFCVTTSPNGTFAKLQDISVDTDCVVDKPCTQRWRMPIAVKDGICSLSGIYQAAFKLGCHSSITNPINCPVNKTETAFRCSTGFGNQTPTCKSFSKQIEKNQQYSWNLEQEASIKDEKPVDLIYKLKTTTFEQAIVSITSNQLNIKSKPNRSGKIIILYTVSDGNTNSTCSIDVDIQNRAPNANPDSIQRERQITGNIVASVLSNDSDADGDALVITKISDKQPSPGDTWVNGMTNSNIAGTTTISNGNLIFSPKAKLASPNNQTSYRIYYTISDQDIDNPLTSESYLDVTIKNQPPICGSPSKLIINKNQIYSKDITSDFGVSDANGDSLIAYKFSNSDKLLISTQGNKNITIQSAPNRSGDASFSFIASDGYVNVTCTVDVTIINHAPVLTSDYFVRYFSTIANSTFNVLDNDKDADGDVLKILNIYEKSKPDGSNWVNGMMNSSFGSLSISSNSHFLKFVPITDLNAGFVYRVYFNVTDQDIDNVSVLESFMDLNVTKLYPTVVPIVTPTDQNKEAKVEIADIVKVPSDPLNRTYVFDGLVPCSNLSSDYCRNAPIIVGNPPQYITVNYTEGSCTEDKFRACIKPKDDSSIRLCSDIIIRYKNCICSSKVDIVFVLDSSGSISDLNWYRQIDFTQNLTQKLIIGPNFVNVGLVQFSNDASIILPMSSSLTDTKNKIESIRTKHQKGYTATIDGFQKAMDAINAGPSDRNAVPKVIVMLTDGIANRPCTCAKCDCDTCSNGKPCSLCTSCTWNPNGGNFCMPCADPTSIANTINGKKIKTGSAANWKIVALGIGDDLHAYNNKGMEYVKDMNFDADQTLEAPWERLSEAVSQIIDQSCNIQL